MNPLVRVVFRGLLRAAHKVDAAGIQPAAALAAIAPDVVAGPSAASNARSMVYGLFRGSAASIDAGLKALPKANEFVQSLTTASDKGGAVTDGAPNAFGASNNSNNSNSSISSSPRFTVGQVFTHARHGYRGVIIGYDSACKASPDWIASTGAASLPAGLNQPFYYALVDVRDRPGCQVSYVAQDNVRLLSSSPPSSSSTSSASSPVAASNQQQNEDHQDHTAVMDADAALSRLVIHPLVTSYFATYLPLQGRFLPLTGAPTMHATSEAAAASSAVAAAAAESRRRQRMELAAALGERRPAAAAAASH